MLRNTRKLFKFNFLNLRIRNSTWDSRRPCCSSKKDVDSDYVYNIQSKDEDVLKTKETNDVESVSAQSKREENLENDKNVEIEYINTDNVLHEKDSKYISESKRRFLSMNWREYAKNRLAMPVPKPIFSMKTINLPSLLNSNLLSFCRSMPEKLLKQHGETLSRNLKGRQKYLHENLNPTRSSSQKNTYKEGKLKKSDQIPYKMINYQEKEASAYVASMSPRVFAATKRVLRELSLRDPEFKPSSILDFGSGTGMTIWAAHSIWNNHSFKMDCVDASPEMLSLSKHLLFNKAEPNVESVFSDVEFSRFFKSNEMYDVVVAAYTLSEFPTTIIRKRVIRHLLNRTKHYLVIVDHGNWNGFKSILAARNFATKGGYQRSDASIVSPCPHVQRCPRTYYDTNTKEFPCSFDIYTNVAFSETFRKKWGYSIETMSFVILRKNARGAENPFYRLMDNPKKEKAGLVCHFCTPKGTIERHFFSKVRHKEAYKALRFEVYGGDELRLPEGYPPSQIKFQSYNVKNKKSDELISELESLDSQDESTLEAFDSPKSLSTPAADSVSKDGETTTTEQSSKFLTTMNNQNKPKYVILDQAGYELTPQGDHFSMESSDNNHESYISEDFTSDSANNDSPVLSGIDKGSQDGSK